ncbi:hypothetical protein LAZ67_20000574 [Cordylochernes scorpioides]|uniref:SV2A/B/C luminal domain-containing protein n=1 Tax=Cordylochernes scorpioides TaxID=51811 RepID=A0ABY6LLJ5_9ARAC|nr:hypothetical protein LAZ67_20000574 [Cordylochernes scorpioides]
MSTTYRCAVRVPGMNGVLLSNEMALQTITPCCGPVWCSTVRPGSTRCPGRLQTRLRRSSGHSDDGVLDGLAQSDLDEVSVDSRFRRCKDGQFVVHQVNSEDPGLFYGLQIWFPEYLKRLESAQYASHTAVEANISVRHFYVNTTLENVRFERTIFRDVTFEHLVLNHVTFSDCAFVNCTFSDITSSMSFFDHSHFLDVDFHQTDLWSYRFLDCRFEKTTWTDTREGCQLDLDLNFQLSRVFFEHLVAQLSLIPGNILSAYLLDRAGRVTTMNDRWCNSKECPPLGLYADWIALVGTAGTFLTISHHVIPYRPIRKLGELVHRGVNAFQTSDHNGNCDDDDFFSNLYQILCVKNEIKCADAFRMLTVAYGEATLDRSNVYRWYKMFSEGREDVNDEELAGRPSTSTTDEKINEVEKMILANRRITVREVAEDLNISIGSCHSIFINDLGMRQVAAKFVPKFLNCDQKQHRMNIANEMLDSVRDDLNLLQRVITGDEAWVYGCDVETKAQSSQWKLPHEPRPKKARQVRSNVKVLLTVFFDCRGVVHHEFLPQGITVNKEYYLQVMRNLREAIRQKRPDLWKNKNWLLHHDNAPAHTSLLVRDFLAKNNTLMMPRSHRIPQIWPPRHMKGRRYATLDEIKTASKEELKNIFKNDFLKCFEDWRNRWHKCIISHGDYFEGDKIGIHE